MKKYATGNESLDAAVLKVCRTARKLQGTMDWPLARRNARARTLAALRALRAALDAEFPAVIVGKRGGPRLTVDGRIDRLVRAGWRQVEGSTAAAFAAAGVTIRHIRGKSRRYGEDTIWIPEWAAAIGVDNPSKLRTAKKSRIEQNAAIAVRRLRDSGAISLLPKFTRSGRWPSQPVMQGIPARARNLQRATG